MKKTTTAGKIREYIINQRKQGKGLSFNAMGKIYKETWKG